VWRLRRRPVSYINIRIMPIMGWFAVLDLSKILSEKNLFKRGTGLIGGRAVIKGRGNSVAGLPAHADGTFGVASSGGQISHLLLEILGLNAVEVIKLLFAGDQEIELRCAVADFEVKNGIMNPRAFVIDTTDTTINIDGSINLRNEQLDLTAQPLPKNFSPLARLHLPLHVTGTFKQPKFGLAAVLAAVIPPTAVLAPLIAMGPGKDSDCAMLIQAVQEHAKMRTP
jgi:uncharacterized protein involved in outer membrane biogenesis